MKAKDLYELREINGKKVYIVESHHHALLPWCLIKEGLHENIILISLDHHTDCRPAFHVHRCIESKYDDAKYAELLGPLVNDFDYRNSESVIRAISKLRYDEQIHTSIMGGIFSTSFSLNFSDQTPSTQERIYQERCSAQFQAMIEQNIPIEKVERISGIQTYELPEGRMFAIASDCSLGCKKMPHDDECLVEHYGEALEAYFLEHQLNIANQMAISSGLNSIYELPYVLDVDLDYFHSAKAIAPKDPNIFYKLIRKSEAITIAMERRCVDLLKLEGEGIDSDMLLTELVKHIDAATS